RQDEKRQLERHTAFRLLGVPLNRFPQERTQERRVEMIRHFGRAFRPRLHHGFAPLRFFGGGFVPVGFRVRAFVVCGAWAGRRRSGERPSRFNCITNVRSSVCPVWSGGTGSRKRSSGRRSRRNCILISWTCWRTTSSGTGGGDGFWR